MTRPGSSALFWSHDPFDARWQRGVVVRGLYLACCAATAWAEWMRATAEDGVPPSVRLPRDVWPLDVDVDGVADLSDQLAALLPLPDQILRIDGSAGSLVDEP